MKTNRTYQELLSAIENSEARSAFAKGVRAFAVNLVESAMERHSFKKFDLVDNDEKLYLNGAKDWKQYVYGGSALVADYDIAKALCSPSELKRRKDGALPPNKDENWLDVEARAYFLAYQLLRELALS